MSSYPSDALRGAVDAADDAVYVTDMHGTIQYVNDAACRITGYARETLIGNTPSLFASGLTSREYYQRMWTSLLTGMVWREAITNRNADGELYECTQSITPLKDADGAVTGFIAIQRDMTERSSVQYEMRRARSDIERALEEKETLLRELSHRTKNDLELLRSMLSLQSATAANEEARQTLTAATDRIAVMSRIYRLFHTRGFDATMSLRTFLNDLVQHWRESFFNGSVAATVEAPDTVLSERILVALGLLTNEIITNTAKYSGIVEADSSGGVASVHVVVTVPTTNTLQLTVTDDGAGFPPDVLDGTRRGLGLQMVQALAQQYDGSMTLRNVDGEDAVPTGAQVVVRLRKR